MNYDKFKDRLGSWGPYLKGFIESEKCDGLYRTLKEEAQRGRRIAPLSINTFRAFECTPYRELKVVFLLQDPYPWEKKIDNDWVLVADGIAMSSVTTGIIQPSLAKFYDGLEDDIFCGLNLNMPRVADLSYLCGRGVMMLNTALSVELQKPGSHFELWKPFTTYLFTDVFANYDRGLIFVLCGENSFYYERFINPLQHYLFKLEHPAAAAHSYREWKHGGIFKKINKLLMQNNNYVLDWVN
jgi:uracil-DNA glycosylase